MSDPNDTVPGWRLPEAWPALLRAQLAPRPAPAESAQLTGLMPEGAAAAAAVLVPIIDEPSGARLLLTQRAGHLRQHAGQVSFPGGRVEAGDDGALGAALREAREEIGIDPRYVEPLGYLPGQLVLTGFAITPVVARVRPGYTLSIDSTEVADVFTLPLSLVAAEASFRIVPRTVRGVELRLRELAWQGRVVWGATAAMLHNLSLALRRCGGGGPA